MPYNKLFPAQTYSEKVFLLIRRHWFAYVIFWLVVILMLIPAFIVGIYWMQNISEISPLAEELIIVGLGVYLLLIMAILIYGFVDYYLDVYIITDKRIVDIKQNGFFNREISELHLHQVQDVQAKVNGVFPTLLHFGDVFIQTAAEVENFTFNSVPHPYRISKIIIDLHQANLEAEDSAKVEAKKELDQDENFNSKEYLIASGSTAGFMKSSGLRELESSDEKGQEVFEEEESKKIINDIEKDKKIIVENKTLDLSKSKDSSKVLEEGKQEQL